MYCDPKELTRTANVLWIRRCEQRKFNRRATRKKKKKKKMAATSSIPLNQNVFRLRFKPSKRHALLPVESYSSPRVFCSGNCLQTSKFFLRKLQLQPFSVLGRSIRFRFLLFFGVLISLVLCISLLCKLIEAIYACVIWEVSRDGPELKENNNMSPTKQLKNVACGILAVWAVTTASPVVAANQVFNTLPYSLKYPFLRFFTSHQSF